MSPLPWLRSNPTHEWCQDALLLAWHRTDGSVHLVFSGQAFFRMPQTIGKEIHLRKWLYPSLQEANPCTFCRISVCPWCFSWREVASLLPFLTPGHPPKVFASLCVQMTSHLPAAIPEQALYWWCPDPAAESLTWCQLVLLWQGWNAVEMFWGDSGHMHGKEGLCN